MKFIGQYIQSFIARFRNDVYLEDVDTGTIASGGNLGLDSNNKIVKATVSSGSGDITGVDLTGAGPISISSETGTTSGDYSATIGIVSASTTVIGAVELATTAETTTGTDTTRAVTPDGLKDGYQGSTNVVTVGTIATGEWRGTAINAAYLSGQSGTNTGDETLATINALDITELGTISSGVWEGTAIAHAYIGTDAIETDNIADAQVTVAKLHADAIQTSGESFADNDTSLMTSAAIDDKINTKYSTSYITFSAKSTSSYGTNYVMIHANGISESTFSVDSSVDSAGDFGGVTTEEGGSGTDATATVASSNLEQQIPIPETCKLIGFYATTSTTTNTGAAYDTGVGIWHVPESGVNWGSSTASTATLIHKSDSSRHTEGSNRKKVQKVERMDGTAKTLGAGDILIPSVFGETSNQQIMATITLVIATPIKTL